LSGRGESQIVFLRACKKQAQDDDVDAILSRGMHCLNIINCDPDKLMFNVATKESYSPDDNSEFFNRSLMLVTMIANVFE
jgi:hypothetical protein